jgi:hypothetical protein
MIDCKARIVGLAPSDNSYGVRIAYQNPLCTPEGLALPVLPVWVWLTLVGIGALTVMDLADVAKEMGVEMYKMRQETIQATLGLESHREAMDRRERITNECYEKGEHTYAECLASATAAVDVKSIPEILKAAKYRKPRGTHWLWLVAGGAAVTAAVAGLVVYRRRRGGKKGKKKK